MVLNKLKKGQSMPLNTIVIAILVIIVLLVIIVFFTTKVGDTSQQLDQQGSVSACDVGSNPTLKALGYIDAKWSTEFPDGNPKCDTGWDRISVVPNSKNSADMTVICCGTKN